MIEFATIRYAPDDIEQQAWIISVVRSLAVVLASIQLLHAICTYRYVESDVLWVIKNAFTDLNSHNYGLNIMQGL